MLVQEGTGRENERGEDFVDEDRRNMLDNEENGFVNVDSDDSEEEDTGEEVNEDHDESSDDADIYADNSELDGVDSDNEN